MPDIDVDFCYERRQEVIDYVVNKYAKTGSRRLSPLEPWLLEAPSGMLAGALDMPYSLVDRVAKEIPIHPGVNITIAEALKENPELKNGRQRCRHCQTG